MHERLDSVTINDDVRSIKKVARAYIETSLRALHSLLPLHASRSNIFVSWNIDELIGRDFSWLKGDKNS
jgi:hypothetical protein